MVPTNQDDRLREIFLAPIRKCAHYLPAFGQTNQTGYKLAEFQALYGSDLFYSWLGLDDPSVYAAHKAAGGLTSVYRQIGVGSERLLRAILGTTLGLSEQQLQWSYSYDKSKNEKGIHTLDACIQINHLDSADRSRFTTWLESVKKFVSNNSNGRVHAEGVVFEVRQGYKSADSKRQNADLRFGVHAYQSGLLPAFAILSSQVSEPVIKRYRSDGMLVLTGIMINDPLISTFAFFEQVVGFHLEGFFARNSSEIKGEIKNVVEKLLSA